MWIDLIDTMMHTEGQGEDGGSRVLAAMWLPSWQRAAAKIGATPKLQHFQHLIVVLTMYTYDSRAARLKSLQPIF
jgi:hypothetical protein